MRCRRLYSYARKRPHTVVFHCFMREPSILPYYMGPMRMLSTSGNVLVPGMIDPRRRNYSLLRFVPPDRTIFLFGRAASNNTKKVLNVMQRFHSKVSRSQGDFTNLLSLARNASYILAPTRKGMYSARTKMSSAISLGVALGLPLIADRELIGALGIPGLPYSLDRAGQITSSFSLNYSALSKVRDAQLRWRHAHFSQGVLAIKTMLDPTLGQAIKSRMRRSWSRWYHSMHRLSG